MATVNISLPESMKESEVKTVFEPDDQDFDPREAYPFIDNAMREDDAHDPSLESYQAAAVTRQCSAPNKPPALRSLIPPFQSRAAASSKRYP